VPSDISPADLTTAINLLRKNSSLGAVSAYLKSHNLASSAQSWQEMREKRLEPALASGHLNRAMILGLVRAAEEYGRQHVFLFECSKDTATEAVSEAGLAKRLAKLDISDLLTKPRLVELGKGLQLVEIRIDKMHGACRALVIKAVDTRSHRVLVKREESEDEEILTYKVERDRAVNLIKVHSDGIAEVRIQSHKNALDYGKAAEDLLAKATDIVDRLKFGDLSLAKARSYLLKNRHKLSKQILYRDTLLRDKFGNAMSLASGSLQQNLYQDGGGADAGLEGFLSAGKPSSDEVNCIWLKNNGGTGPSGDIPTFIGGANNEFVVLAHCDGADYDYVLEKITAFAQ
jgi:hypothetical protein